MKTQPPGAWCYFRNYVSPLWITSTQYAIWARNPNFVHYCFVCPIFRFWSLWAVMLQKSLFTFFKARWARREKSGMKITQLKWPKYQKPKDEKIWVERNTYKDLNSPTNQNQNYFWQLNAVWKRYFCYKIAMKLSQNIFFDCKTDIIQWSHIYCPKMIDK